VGTAATDFIPEPAALNDLIALSQQKMLPEIKPELSLLNSIYELKDFKSIGPQIASIKKLSQSTFSSARRQIRPGELLRDYVREMGGASCNGSLTSLHFCLTFVPYIRHCYRLRNV